MSYLKLLIIATVSSLAAAASGFDLIYDAGSKSVIIYPDKSTDVIRYTLNGKDPDFSAGNYLAPIELPLGGIVKAAQFDEKNIVGKVVTKSLPVDPSRAPNSAETPLTQNRDWRSYDWVTRHNEIIALNKPGAIQADVVFIGDSITHFWSGEPKAKRIAGRESWDKWIAPHRPINLGYGWDRTENVLWRLRHGEISGLKPKAFVVLIGTNNLSGINTVADTAEGVAEVCRELRRQAPQAKVLLLAILPRQAKPDATRQRVTDTNKLLKAQAPQIADAYVDLTDKLVEADGSILKETMGDYLHPTNKGYEVMGAAIDAQLKAWSL
jgi:lysophospholipase L1-like esterase